jgi:hypothetical protein
VVRDKAGNIVQTTGGDIKWDVGTGKTSDAIAEPRTVDNIAISTTSIDEQYFEIKPFMTVDATAGGTALDVYKAAQPNDDGSLPTYSITITVTDGAKRTSEITKQFTLDNTPPVFVKEKYNPLSFKYGLDDKPAAPEGDPLRSYSYDAVTGKLNIRGNTTDNSNQIKSISYYVVNSAESSSFTAYPKPAWVETNNKWLSGKDAEIKIDGTTLIQLDEGTLFAWSILAPQTSLFLSGGTDAEAYAYPTTTNGTTITGDPSPKTGEFRELVTALDPADWATKAKVNVPQLTFPDLNNLENPANPKVIYGNEDVGLITIYVRAEDAAGNVAYDALKYWIWPEGDRPIITAINTPNSEAPEVERYLNGTIRLSGMAKDNERVRFVWFRVLNHEGVPYGTGGLKPLTIPKWKYEESGVPIGGNWEEAGTGNQIAVDGTTIGARKTADNITAPTGGWYMANGGNSRDVSWWAYINTSGELDPQGDEIMRQFTVEVRAQDITFDEKNDRWMDYPVNVNPPVSGYRGMASAMTKVSKTDAWVVANAPVFDNQRIAAAASDTVTNWDIKEANNTFTYSVDNVSLNKRSSYKVTVTHKVGLSSIRWSPTQWYKDKNITADTGVFRANPNIDAFNLLATNITNYTPGTSYVYLNSTGTGYLFGDKDTAFAALTAGTTTMAAHVVVEEWDATSTYAMKCDVFVDLRADKLLDEMLVNDPAYGDGSAARAGQTKNSVRYPLYMSASDISKATPITSRGDALLPIDNKAPYGMYTLNRKPAGTAVTIGGEAGDDGPVNGVARVVLWFQRDGQGVSWHERSPIDEMDMPAATPAFKQNNDDGPAWWNAVTKKTSETDPNGVLPATGVQKPFIPTTATAGTGGDYAIVIDTNSPSVGVARWGHKLPTGFADGGIGKLWYVEINSYGLKSGPVDLCYVVIDKAGNATYYKEKLVIMNDVAIIDRVKLATDIRHNTTAFPATLANRGSLAGAKIIDKDPLDASQWPILKDIRSAVPLGGSQTDIKEDVRKGISDWVSASALGADKVIDFNVRNRMFALRVETTKKPASDKTRTFNLEYVSGATLLTNTGLLNIKAGSVYIINERGTARWGTFGAEGDDWKRGYAFIATVSGSELDQLTKDNIGTGSAWELTTTQKISTSSTDPAAATGTDAANAASAEFQYGTGAFSAIADCNGPEDVAFPPTGTWGTWTNNNWSLFILRVFDGKKDDYFGDFTILRVRVNNDDKSPPFAQLYDLNPKTEGQDRSNIAGNDQTVEKRRSVSPMFIGEGAGSNRTKGGLWNDSDKLGSIEKPGHIEPRRNGSGATATHPSLSSAQMGGAATAGEATITKPFANPQGFIDTKDLVSGQVVLRGYAEDDQRVQRVSLVIGGQTINILDYHNNRTENTDPTKDGYGVEDTTANRDKYLSPKTGLLKIATGANAAPADRVFFTDSIDLYRHRVEWAYIWNTEAIPSATNVAANDIGVRVIAYPRDGAAGETHKTSAPSAEITVANGKAHVDTLDLTDPIERTRPNTRPFNKEFPVGLYKYNSITVNLRPYITGFLRNKTQFSHDTRSRQGRYMFARNEIAVLKGFNLGSGTIKINNGTDITTSNVGTGGTSIGDFGITTANNNHYRQFTVGTGIRTGSGLVTYTYNSQGAVNTGSGREITTTTEITTPNYVPATARPTYIQPWNIEYSPGIDGSTLWDDFTQVHIWQSNDNAPGGANNTADNASGRFYSRENGLIFNPAMSMDPRTGLLYESHNESGYGGNGWYNTGSTKKSGINNNSNETVTQFADPIFFSDVYRSPGNGTDATSADTGAVSSIIGRSSDLQWWRALGGIYINGPGGRGIAFYGGGTGSSDNSPSNQSDVYSSSLYHGESAWYNASNRPGARPATPPATDQFMNPHIVTSYSGTGNSTQEHIHVSYYDDKDGSIKYRYNLRNSPGTLDPGGNDATNDPNNIPKMWTNLDGGYDAEDTDQTTYTTSGTINPNDRVVNLSGRGTDKTKWIKAGRHNSIAVNSSGYPVIAYYDETNQRLKLAVSKSYNPVLASAWEIYPNISKPGTGEFVSMKIDTKASPNVVHIAAMNTNLRLVYITFTLNVSNGTVTVGPITEQVVDSVGSVGRWCALSLDERGNPWISYMDGSWVGARDGAKVAYKDTTTFYKGSSIYRNGEDKDIEGNVINGWEAMHVPTLHRVVNPIEGNGREHGRLGMECFPARNYTPNSGVTRFWSGAVGYLSQDAEMNGNTQVAAPMDRYRIAYYVK